MADVLNEALARLRAENDLDLAAVSVDGMTVGADHADGLDVETLSTTAGDWHLMMTAYGTQLDNGEPAMLTIEYESATVMVKALEHGAILILVANHAVNLGRLRVAARRFQEQYRGAMAPVA